MAVYFIQAVSGGPVKIGHARNVQRRLSLIQTGNPERLRVFRIIEGGFEVEAQAHKDFASGRILGEWFNFDALMLHYGKEVVDQRTTDKSEIHRYLKAERGRFGSLADALGINQSAISQWRRVPAERVLEVERHTGLSRHVLRPDIHGASA